MFFLRHFIFADGFRPYGYCSMRTPHLPGMHVVSDFLIAATHLATPRKIRNGLMEISG
jgi:hypothetical protein